MRTLTQTELWLVLNALREKAEGDEKWGDICEDEALSKTMHDQALRGRALHDEIEEAGCLTIHDSGDI